MSGRPEPICNWRDGETCQFNGRFRIAAFEGRNYCQAHAPLRCNDGLARDELLHLLKTFPPHNFRGIAIRGSPSGTYTIGESGGEPFDFRDCTVSPGAQLSFNWDANLSNSVFEGNVTIVCYRGAVECSNAKVRGDMHIALSNAGIKSVWAGSEFFGKLSIEGNPPSRARFDACTFHQPMSFRLHDIGNTTFHGVTILPTAITKEAEFDYRTLRNLYHSKRARDWEGFFYTLEKRCHRLSIPRRFFIPRLVSWIYDKASLYGYSYARPLGWLVLLQFICGFAYSFRSERFGIGQIDVPIVKFTLAQFVRPFDFFSLKSDPSVGFTIDGSLFWPVVALLQSTISIVLLALMLLALQWRFRRE